MEIFTAPGHQSERDYLRDFIQKHMEYANSDLMEQRRQLWANHNALNFTRPLILNREIPFDEFFDPKQLKCTDPYLRNLEYWLHVGEYRKQLPDDFIEAPYYTIRAAVEYGEHYWGIPSSLGERPTEVGAAAFSPSLLREEDVEKIQVRPHAINEALTDKRYSRLAELTDGVADVYVDRQGVLCETWQNDISTPIAKMRGLEQLMWDIMDRPEWLHKLLAKMRDLILKNMDETEQAGDFSLINHENQAMPFLVGLDRPGPGKATQNRLWGFMAAQEFTGFGPELFKEFMFEYQRPILERYAVVAYGCCEDMTQNIELLKTLPNLRRIAVTPFSDLARCAEQIGPDYILSWRPNPSDMVAHGVDEDHVRSYIRTGIDIMKQNHCKYDITLKDVQTVSGDPNALIRWTTIVREEINRAY